MYVRIRSWHIVDPRWRRQRTFCGREGPFSGQAQALVLDEKSCETCLRYSRVYDEARRSPDSEPVT